MIFNYKIKAELKDITNKALNDLDFASLLDGLRDLMSTKNKGELKYVLMIYLNYLIVTGDFETFKSTYISHREFIQKNGLKNFLQRFEEILLSVKSDRSEYKQLLFRHSYSSYHNVDGPLEGVFKEVKESWRKRDQHIEIQQRYELGEYKEILNLLEKIQNNNAYEKLLNESVKQRCLYYLQEKTLMPNEIQCMTLSGMKWKHLLETGQELYYDDSDEIIFMIRSDIKR